MMASVELSSLCSHNLGTSIYLPVSLDQKSVVAYSKFYPDESKICVELVLGSTQNIVFATRNLLHYFESRNMDFSSVQLNLHLFSMYQKCGSPCSAS